MRRLLMMTALAVTAIGGGQMAMAETRPDAPPPECRQNDRKCPPRPANEAGKKGERPKGERREPPPREARRDGHEPPPGEARRDGHEPPPGEARRDGRKPPPQARDHRPGETREAKGKPSPDGRKAPRLGESGRDGRVFKRAGNSRYAPAPRGQEYRVIRDQLVLVDKKTKRILSILGPLQAQR
ncbi:MAG: hypothetical protein QM682_04260 [Paracoccus sp. (in: a-proteobacteria)]|uniref:hypothetical protein n=1 Tax=Paracoccus sp. TaxID=267 RepID=UPI0039E5C846